jgi:hypothetical protein
MAQQFRKPLPPNRSLPPLRFDDPELDALLVSDAPPPPSEAARTSFSELTFRSLPPAAGDQHSSRGGAPPRADAHAATQPMHGTPVASGPSPVAEVAAILEAIPSVPPEPVVDPSFAPAPEASVVSVPEPPPTPLARPFVPPPAPPTPWYVALLRRMDALVDAVVAWLPNWPRALENVPVPVVLTIALVALFFQVGVAVRWFRWCVRLCAALIG